MVLGGACLEHAWWWELEQLEQLGMTTATREIIDWLSAGLPGLRDSSRFVKPISNAVYLANQVSASYDGIWYSRYV